VTVCMLLKPPSQPQASQSAGHGGKKLKREGAIADINALYEKVCYLPIATPIRTIW
jgi:hypothetical protein